MALRRSASTHTTFSVYITRKTKYQRYLGILNVLLLLGSLTITFFGLVLKLTYYMDQLDFISSLFQILPLYLTFVGVCTFILSSIGFIFSSSESRPLILVYAGLTAALALCQIGTVFVTMLARSEIRSAALEAKTGSAILNYETDERVRAKWDYLQTRLRCCGAYGFTDYQNVDSDHFGCVPETCCFGATDKESIEVSRCTWTAPGTSCPQDAIITKNIYVRGCLNILGEMYKADLVDLMLLYGLGGTAFVLVELVSVFLAFAYSSQLARRAKREREHWTPGEDLTRGGGAAAVGGVTNNVVPMDNFDDGNLQ